MGGFKSSGANEKVIITCALTGAWPKKANNPAIPETPKEIADSAYEAYQAGASIVHIHTRDENENGCMDTEQFVEIGERIREKCDVITCFTTSGDLVSSDEKRMEHIPLVNTEMASYDCGSFNWGDSDIYKNSPQFLMKLGEVMKELKIKPEIEIMNDSMVYLAKHYIEMGILDTPAHFQFCLGMAGGIEATVENLMHLRSLIPEGSTWSAFGLGHAHMPILMASIALGGHVRVGFEDNVYYRKGQLAKSNAELVARAARVAEESTRGVATVEEAREILGLQKK